MGDLQSVPCVPNAMARHLEMPRPFRLGSVGMSLHMTTQGFPIQLARPLWAGALVRHPAGLEPAIHAGLADLEPPGCLGLAATAPDEIHHPLTQIE